VRSAAAIASVLAVLVALGLAFFVLRNDEEDERPARPIRVDPVAGSVASVRLGDTRAKAEARLGPAPPWNDEQSVEPLEEDWNEIGAPSGMDYRGTPYVLRYPHTTVELENGRVIAIVTAERGARTPAGIGVGDALDAARDAYPALECWDAAREGFGTYPVCSGRVKAKRWLWFGEDPIRSIAIASRRLG
jgi:hypothetical protein